MRERERDCSAYQIDVSVLLEDLCEGGGLVVVGGA